MTATELDYDATKADPSGRTDEVSTIPLETLTDEELSVLAPDQGVVVMPVLTELPPGELDAVRRTAFRGLVARGIVDPPEAESLAAAQEGAASGDVALELRVRNDVLSALTLRQSASAVIAAGRTTSTGQDFWYAHLVEDVVLLEEVSLDGLHHFALGRARDLGTLLEGAVLHPEATDGEGLDVELAVAPDSDAPAELLEVLGRAYLRADVLVVRREGSETPLPDLTGLFTGPQGSWSVLARPGSQRAWATPETVAELRTRVRAMASLASAATSPGRQEPTS